MTMPRRRRDAHPRARPWPFVILTILLLVPGAVEAMENGITGYAGNNPLNPFTCTQCHDGGVAPTVSFSGPMRVPAGTSSLYTFTLQSNSQNQLFGGLDVAVGAGTLAVGPTETDGQIENGELTHKMPKPVDANLAVSWTFVWEAPTTIGPVKLYGAGLSANGNGNNSGDYSAKTTYTVNVTPPPQPGDANCDDRLSAADVVAVAAIIVDATANTCDLADADCSGTVDADDIPIVVASVFDSTPRLPCP